MDRPLTRTQLHCRIWRQAWELPGDYCSTLSRGVDHELHDLGYSTIAAVIYDKVQTRVALSGVWGIVGASIVSRTMDRIAYTCKKRRKH